jgi:hypothetical protein
MFFSKDRGINEPDQGGNRWAMGEADTKPYIDCTQSISQ